MLFKRIVSVCIIVLALAGGVLVSCWGVTGEMTITVTDAAGNPLSGTKVTSESQPAGQLKLTGITTASSNTVTLTGRAGEYEIQINRFDYEIQNINVTIRPGRITSVKVRLEKG